MKNGKLTIDSVKFIMAQILDEAIRELSAAHNYEEFREAAAGARGADLTAHRFLLATYGCRDAAPQIYKVYDDVSGQLPGLIKSHLDRIQGI